MCSPGMLVNERRFECDGQKNDTINLEKSSKNLENSIFPNMFITNSGMILEHLEPSEGCKNNLVGLRRPQGPNPGSSIFIFVLFWNNLDKIYMCKI